METLINFFKANYIYFVFIGILIALALIGYIIDKTKTEKLKKEYTKTEEEKDSDIPTLNLNENITIGESLSKMTLNGVNKEETKEEAPAKIANNSDTPTGV